LAHVTRTTHRRLALAAAAREMLALRLAGASRVGDGALASIAANLPHLETLSVRSCFAVGRRAPFF